MARLFTPMPLRLEAVHVKLLDKKKKQTGLSRADIIRKLIEENL